MEYINIFGLIFMLIIMIPNIVFAIKCKDGFENAWNNKKVELLEQIGRFGCMAFMIVKIPGARFGFASDEAFALYLMINSVLLFLYCMIWIVCFRKNTVFRALALSIIPSVVFLFSGIISGSVLLIIAAIVFAPSHIMLSYKNAVLAKKYVIREIKDTELHVLEDFLYEAIFIPEGVTPPPRDIINKPELRVYISEFGEKEGDTGLVAEVGGKIVGAVWVRIMNDYGHIDDHTPSFAISLYKEYRNLGIGTAMMQKMISMLKEKGYKQASLAVQKENYAVKMYKNVGFEIVDENAEEYIMVYRLK